MKKRNLIFIITIFAIVWLAAYYTIGIKIPSYLYITSLQLPEDTVNIKTKVEVSDDAGWHIAAERLIYTSYTEDELNLYIDKNNNTYANVSHYIEAEFLEWDWQIIRDVHLEVPESERSHYFLVSHYVTGSQFDFLFCFGIFSTIVICILLYRFLKRFVKNALLVRTNKN